MIRQFRHKGVERFFVKGATQGVREAHIVRLRLQLARLDDALSPEDMNAPPWKAQPWNGHWSVQVDHSWRLVFDFEDENAILLDYRKTSAQEP